MTGDPAAPVDPAKPVDAVVIGMGWAGSIVASELVAAGLRVVGLERGAARTTHADFTLPQVHDELRYAQHHELMQDLSRETITFRNRSAQTALPMRQYGSFLIGDGLGGGGTHWNGQTFRFLPQDFRAQLLRGALRPDLHSGGHDPAGLGRQLRRSGAALRPLRISVRHFRTGREHPR